MESPSLSVPQRRHYSDPHRETPYSEPHTKKIRVPPHIPHMETPIRDLSQRPLTEKFHLKPPERLAFSDPTRRPPTETRTENPT